MAFTTGPTRRQAMAEINVTPLVDVMLVLLVIFMVTAPLMNEGVQVEVPEASVTTPVPTENTLRLVLARDGTVQVPSASDGGIRGERLVAAVQQWRLGSTAPNPTVIIVADRLAPYERVVQVWNAVLAAGITHVSFHMTPSGAPTP